MQKAVRLAAIFGCFAMLIATAGCSDKFWDPTQLGRFRPVPAVNVILDNLGVADEESNVWKGAEEPKPADVIPYETDYVFGPGDVLRISIYELRQEGLPFVNDYVITETGKVSIPDIGTVQAEGLTESQLEEELKRILSPSILKEPAVTASLLSSQQRSFSIYGSGVPQSGRYFIPRYDFRLTDALATAGGIGQFNISYIYISRQITGNGQALESVEDQIEQLQPQTESGLKDISEEDLLDIVTPHAAMTDDSLVMVGSEMVTMDELAAIAAPAEVGTGTVGSVRDRIETPIENADSGSIEWVFEDGKWIPVKVGETSKQRDSASESGKSPQELIQELPDQFNWDEVSSPAVMTRLIEIPADKLRSGDPRYNVIVRPGDSIHVPVDVIGEFFVFGNMNQQGAVPMTGRPLTLKMAIAAAGGLGPLAWPKRIEITRRIGRNREETVMVDLDKIASGEQPDFFIKPLDLINVGTHPTARWRAVLRNAFRATYGFGFIYDRNFADRDFGTSRPIPNLF